ncbi:glutamate-gated chloride channel-like [Argiope bruennichi]|uniref:glutamate-gated chloride channel-like n=1 Tax=Argiope bruennichi TaxID=94029 RepID=UPI002494E3EB|nr:glutamate-gated chloride channel-like [Argiope bruennichi]
MVTRLLWKYLKEMISIMIFVSVCIRGQEQIKEIKFSDVIPVDYDYLRPPTVNDTPVVVTITITDVNIRSIDESDMSFSVVITLWQGWSDFRLLYPSWIESPYQVLDSRWADKLWTPNLYFVNAVEGKMNNIITPSSFFWISKDKKVYYCVRLVLKLVCEMNLVHFPHDEQQCGVKMAPAFYNEKLLVLTFSNSTRSGTEFSSLQQFEIIDVVKDRCHLTSGSNNVSCLEEIAVLRRRSGYYLINVYIPTILIVVMSMLTFWIPHDAVPARVTLGVTSLLTIITKQYQASMPSVSYIVALNIWLSSCIAFVFFSLLEYAAVIAMTTKKQPSHLFQDSPDLILPMVLLKANGTWSTKQCWSNSKHQKEGLGPKRLDFFSRLFFPISFLVFCISYWRYYS